MNNRKIKVSGYSQRIFYNNGIEYRPYSSNLVGLQSTSSDDDAVFTLGNFNVSVNSDSRLSKFFSTKQFSDFYNLENLGIDNNDLKVFFDRKKLSLKLDNLNLKNYAYFGSMKEFLRISLENIILNWPAGFFSYPVDFDNPNEINYSYYDLVYDELNNISTFKVKKKLIINRFNVRITPSNSIFVNNELRDFSSSYSKYEINFSGSTFPIIDYSDLGDFIELKVNSDISSSISTNNVFLIKPISSEIEKFFKNLSNFEKTLLNRNSSPIYSASFYYNMIDEFGITINTEKTVTWPVVDGYNIEFDSEEYIDYVTKLIEISENSDVTDSDIISRMLISNSILEFDTVPNVIGELEVKEGQKINSLLKIYGRNFDEVKQYIDGISFANVVTYDDINNTPNELLSSLANTLGWDVFNISSDFNFVSEFLSINDANLVKNRIELQYEFWKRLILNTPWLWKSKGTRKGIEFLIKFLGIPDGLLIFNEYIYKVKNNLDVNEIQFILDNISGNTLTIDDLPITLDGFPKIPTNSNDMYFQKSGGWYRQTGGENSNIDLYTGNNPHLGSYDGGQEYIDQFKNLIPDFHPVTIIQENEVENTINLFSNNDFGEFDILPDSGNIEVLNDDWLDLTEYVTYTNSVQIKEPKVDKFDDCGCLVNETDGMLVIDLSVKPIINECKYTGFSFGDDGIILFNYNGDISDSVSQECCKKLGFTPELGPDKYYICRWKEIKDSCDNYKPLKADDDNWYFLNIDNEVVTVVPFAECCPVGSIPRLVDGGYECLVEKIVNPCDNFTPTGAVLDNYLVFNNSANNSETVYVPSTECCTSLSYEATITNQGISCLACKTFVSSSIIDGYFVFVDTNGSSFDVVNKAECCPTNSTPELLLDGGIKCRTNRDSGGGSGDLCRYLTKINGIPNPSGGLTSITVSGEYCNSERFSFTFVNSFGGVVNLEEIVEACVKPNSIVISAAPQRVNFTWNDNERCLTPSGPQLYLGLRSKDNLDSFNDFRACDLISAPLNRNVLLELNEPLVINIGDIVRNADANRTIFNGQNRWYRLVLSVVNAENESVVAKIGTNGVITNINNCN